MSEEVQICFYLNANIFKEVPGGKNVIVRGAANRNIELRADTTTTLKRTTENYLLLAVHSNHNLVTGESQRQLMGIKTT